LVAHSQLPQCTTTTCVQDSDCPNFVDPNYFPTCISGVCSNTNIVKIDIGQPCNTSDPSGQCRVGLFCSSVGTGGSSVCQHTRSFGCQCDADEECTGGLCLNNSCDALRSIGDSCTADLQCGSVCNNQVCDVGSVGDKCNSDKSCASGFCSEEVTCQTDARPTCSASNPNGQCEDSSSVCFGGICYLTNGDAGSSCNSSLPFPQCKVTLGCIDGACAQVPEGTPCSDRSVCSLVQDCVCGGDNSSLYGCYTKIGVTCADAYQALDDCLGLCTETQSMEIPNTCANKCQKHSIEYACCEGCATHGTFYNWEGSCPTLSSTSCCSSTVACSELDNEAVCAASNSTADSSSSSSESPSSTSSSPSSSTTSSPSPSPTPGPASDIHETSAGEVSNVLSHGAVWAMVVIGIFVF